MRKLVAVGKSVVFSFLVYMWFLGSSLLIRIDSGRDDKRVWLINEQERLFGKWDREMKGLRRRIADYCERSSSGSGGGGEGDDIVRQAKKEKTIRDNLIYIPELNQLWCLVPKAASTSWSFKLVDLIGKVGNRMEVDLRNESIPVQVVLKKYYGNVGTKKLNEIIKSRETQRVLLVRHPLSRIISAFEDKLKNRKAKADSMFFYGHYGVKINRVFRKNRRENKRKEPTFEEFVDYLIETNSDLYDEHWRPIHQLCGPCHINYTHVIRQEDLQTGSMLEYHLARLGFGVDLPRNKLRNENRSVKDFKSINDYFRNITAEKRMELLRKYEDDFNYFLYKNNEWG